METAEDRRPAVELEMLYTPWESSCKDLAVLPDDPGTLLGRLRECRRQAGHKGTPHASGFGKYYREWGGQ